MQETKEKQGYRRSRTNLTAGVLVPGLLSRRNHERTDASAHNSPGLLQRRALQSCACRKKEFDPGAAPIFQTSTIKTSVTSLKIYLHTPAALPKTPSGQRQHNASTDSWPSLVSSLMNTALLCSARAQCSSSPRYRAVLYGICHHTFLVLYFRWD